MAWTNINKPVGPTWTNDNGQGREQYDQSNIEYDQADIFYDGINPNQWTDVAKPTTPTWTNIAKPV